MAEIAGDALCFVVFGKEAVELSKRLGITMTNESTDLNTKVAFRHKYAGGIEVTIQIPVKKREAS